MLTNQARCAASNWRRFAAHRCHQIPKLALPAALALLATLTSAHLHAATTLAIIGDYGDDGDPANRVAAMVNSTAWQTDYVVTAGDNNYGSVAVGHPDWETLLGSRYGRYMRQRSGPGPNPYPSQVSPTQRFFPNVGNHDVGPDGLVGYLDYFHNDPEEPAGRLPTGTHSAAHSFYDVEIPIDGGAGSIRIFAMDSEAFVTSPASQAAQIDWLRDGLRGSDAPWNFVTVHRPPFSSGPNSISPLVQLPFQQWGADAVFSGHDHLYERLRVTDASQDEMLYIVNGLGGANNTYPFINRAPGSDVRYNLEHGAMRMTVTDEEAKFEFFAVPSDQDPTLGGELIDAYTLFQSHLPTPPDLTADFNDDGFVNNIDLGIWKQAFGASNSGDADDDGDSDGSDFLAWQAQASSFQPLSISAQLVPEPCAWALGSAAALLLSAPSRQRRR